MSCYILLFQLSFCVVELKVNCQKVKKQNSTKLQTGEVSFSVANFNKLGMQREQRQLNNGSQPQNLNNV